jgi:hypothetical protein
MLLSNLTCELIAYLPRRDPDRSREKIRLHGRDFGGRLFLAVFTSILEHYKYKIRLNSTTQTMGELRALVSEWEAMGEISKRMIDARTRLVQVTEGVELSHAEAWAGPAGGLRAVAADDRGGSAADQPVPCKEGA